MAECDVHPQNLCEGCCMSPSSSSSEGASGDLSRNGSGLLHSFLGVWPLPNHVRTPSHGKKPEDRMWLQYSVTMYL
jgi:hypothetical protein